VENKAEYYYDELEDTLTPGKTLAKYYCVLYGKEVSKAETIFCNKLVGIFGRFTVFFSIQSMAGTYPEAPTDPYPLLYRICNNRFEEAHGESTLQSRENLSKAISDIREQIEAQKKARKFTPPSAEGLEV